MIFDPCKQVRLDAANLPDHLADLTSGRGGLGIVVRVGEVIAQISRHRYSAEWADIDLDGAEWRYTATKTDTPHVVPLARQAVEILRELHPVTGHHRYVFPNARYRQRDRTMSNTTFWGAFRALDIPPERMTPHGFRAMARTILDEVLGFRPDFIEHQLAHRVRDPNGRAYNRTAFLPERRVMMQAWADYLDRLRAGEEIEATHGTGAFRNTNVAGDPGTPTHGPPFPVAGAVPPTVGPVPSSPPGSFAVAPTPRLDGRRTG